MAEQRWWTLGLQKPLALADRPKDTATKGSEEAPTTTLKRGAVVVATGAARGITHRLLLGLAAQVADLRCVLLVRTEGVAPDKSPLHGADEATQRQRAKAALTARGARITPANVRRWLEGERRKVEIHHNMEALRALGAEVTVYGCDLSSEASLAKTLPTLTEQWPKVDLLLHGAGIEISKPLPDKEPSSWDETFVPKAAAGWQLQRALKPQRSVAMGSISGRFGNAMQADYAAANEALAAWARAPNSQCLTLDWTAWADVGMATRGSVAQVLASYGVEMLPAVYGEALALRLFAQL